MVSLLDNSQAQGVAVPLFFRTLDEQQAFAEESSAPPAPPAFDMESHLRAAREETRREVMAAAEERMARELAEERAVLARVLRQLDEEKKRYFSEVESEVVKLSLAIAERVLHREAEMDPLLLEGAARVALDQVQENSATVLRVAAQDTERWRDRLQPAPKGLVIEPDDALQRGDVILKTQSGTVELGLRAQLQEIERGFFQLLGHRPASAM